MQKEVHIEGAPVRIPGTVENHHGAKWTMFVSDQFRKQAFNLKYDKSCDLEKNIYIVDADMQLVDSIQILYSLYDGLYRF